MNKNHNTFKRSALAAAVALTCVQQVSAMDFETDGGWNPDGHPKLLHLWPPKLPQAGRLNYQLFGPADSDFLSW